MDPPTPKPNPPHISKPPFPKYSPPDSRPTTEKANSTADCIPCWLTDTMLILPALFACDFDTKARKKCKISFDLWLIQQKTTLFVLLPFYVYYQKELLMLILSKEHLMVCCFFIAQETRAQLLVLIYIYIYKHIYNTLYIPFPIYTYLPLYMILFVHVLILTIFVNTNLKNLSELIFLSNKRNVFFSCFFWIWWWKSQWWWWWVDDDDDVHTQLDGDDDMMMMLVGLRDVCGWLINGMRLLLVPTWDRLDDALFYWLDLILMMMMMAPATCDPWNRSNPWKIYKFLFLFSLSFFVSFSLFQITYFTTHAHTHLMCTSVNYCHRQRPRPPTSRSQILRRRAQRVWSL